VRLRHLPEVHVVALRLLGQASSDEVFSRTNDALLLNSQSFDRKITANYTAAIVIPDHTFSKKAVVGNVLRALTMKRLDLPQRTLVLL